MYSPCLNDSDIFYIGKLLYLKCLLQALWGAHHFAPKFQVIHVGLKCQVFKYTLPNKCVIHFFGCSIKKRIQRSELISTDRSSMYLYRKYAVTGSPALWQCSQIFGGTRSEGILFKPLTLILCNFQSFLNFGSIFVTNDLWIFICLVLKFFSNLLSFLSRRHWNDRLRCQCPDQG